MARAGKSGESVTVAAMDVMLEKYWAEQHRYSELAGDMLGEQSVVGH